MQDLNMEQKKTIHNFIKKKTSFKISEIFITSFLKKGKKTKAELLWFKILKTLKEKKVKKTYSSIYKAIYKISPLVDLRSLRRGRTVYQVPTPLRNKKRIALGIKWLVEDSLKDEKKKFHTNLSSKILEAEKGLGRLVEKRKAWHKTARSKMLYLRYRWF